MKIKIISPIIYIVPEFINRILESLQVIIEKGLKLFENNKKKIKNEKEEEEEIIEKEEIKNNLISINFEINKGNIHFKNENKQILSFLCTLEGKIDIKNNKIDIFNCVSDLIEIQTGKNLIKTYKVLSLRKMLITYFNHSIPTITIAFDSILFSISNKDVDNSIKLFKEFTKTIEQINFKRNKQEIQKEQIIII